MKPGAGIGSRWPADWMTDKAATVVDDRIRAGQLVRCRTGDNKWITKVACSPVLHGYKFNTVLVTSNPPDCYGWPADDVELIG